MYWHLLPVLQIPQRLPFVRFVVLLLCFMLCCNWCRYYYYFYYYFDYRRYVIVVFVVVVVVVLVTFYVYSNVYVFFSFCSNTWMLTMAATPHGSHATCMPLSLPLQSTAVVPSATTLSSPSTPTTFPSTGITWSLLVRLVCGCRCCWETTDPRTSI